MVYVAAKSHLMKVRLIKASQCALIHLIHQISHLGLPALPKVKMTMQSTCFELIQDTGSHDKLMNEASRTASERGRISVFKAMWECLKGINSNVTFTILVVRLNIHHSFQPHPIHTILTVTSTVIKHLLLFVPGTNRKSPRSFKKHTSHSFSERLYMPKYMMSSVHRESAVWEVGYSLWRPGDIRTGKGRRKGTLVAQTS